MVFENMALSCPTCNTYKGVKTTATDPSTNVEVTIFHPRKQPWEDPFEWSEDGLRVIGKTPTGRATCELLLMNRSQLLRYRRAMILLEKEEKDP